MSIRHGMALIILVFLPFIGYEINQLNGPPIMKLFTFLGYVVIASYLTLTGFRDSKNGL